MAPCEFGGVQHVRELALAVAREVPREVRRAEGRLGGFQRAEVNSSARRRRVRRRGQGDDADVSTGLGGGREERWEKHFRQECVPEVVGCELDFVAVCAEGRRGRYDAGVAHEDVEAGDLGEEVSCGVLYGGEAAEVALEEDELRRSGGLLDFSDQLFGFGCVATAEEDLCGIVGCEEGDGAGS